MLQRMTAVNNISMTASATRMRNQEKGFAEILSPRSFEKIEPKTASAARYSGGPAMTATIHWVRVFGTAVLRITRATRNAHITVSETRKVRAFLTHGRFALSFGGLRNSPEAKSSTRIPIAIPPNNDLKSRTKPYG